MRFLALFRKEMREAAPWLVLAAVATLLLGGGAVRSKIAEAQSLPRAYWPREPGGRVFPFDLLQSSGLQDCGPVVLLAAAGLGLALAVTQFLMPGLLQTWPFTLHRSASPLSILLAKAAATATALCLGVGAVWTGLFLWASRPEALRYRPDVAVLAEGWLMVATGMVVYFGAAASAQSPARWYTTRTLPLFAATGIVVLAFVATSIPGFAAAMLVGVAILAPQVLHLFLNGEH